MNTQQTNYMNWGLIGVGTLIGLYGIWCGVSYYTRASVEKLSYQVTSTIKSKKYNKIVEIRKYPPFLIAEASYSQTEMRQAMNMGFRDIAGFIFGKNVAPNKNQSQKIAMTAPVTISQSNQNQYTISFVMPSKYSKQTLPKPTNQKVEIKQVGAQKMACLSWRGNVPTPEQVQQKERQLREILKQQCYTAKGKVILYEYDPPFTPGWMRINQILLAIE